MNPRLVLLLWWIGTQVTGGVAVSVTPLRAKDVPTFDGTARTGHNLVGTVFIAAVDLVADVYSVFVKQYTFVKVRTSKLPPATLGVAIQSSSSGLVSKISNSGPALIT